MLANLRWLLCSARRCHDEATSKRCRAPSATAA